jgi:hypothetical protein
MLSLSPQAPALCPGQCVTLTPQISGGLAPYTLRWSDGMATAGAPREVCPTATTTYTAVAVDSSGGGGELPHPPSQAAADDTVTIASSACAGSARDGGLSEDGSATALAPIPATGLHTLCTADWQTSSSGIGSHIRSGGAAVALDPAGNIIAATSFYGSFGTAAGAPRAIGSDDLMVMKLDAQCHVVWTRQYGAPSCSTYLSAVETDADGNVVVAGFFQTIDTTNPAYWLDLGSGRLESSHFGAFVTKLDPTGKTLWVRAYIPQESTADENIVQDLAVDPSGNAVFAFGGKFNFGTGSSVDAGATGYDVVKLDPNGALVFAKPGDEVGDVAYDIESVDTARDGTIWIEGSDQTTALVWAAHLRSDGSILSKISMPSPLAPTLTTGGAVRVGPSGDAVLSGTSSTSGTSSAWNRWLEGLSPPGNVTWTLGPIDVNAAASDPAQLVRLDSSGNAWTAGTFLGSQNFGSPVGTLSSPSSTVGAMFVVIYGPDGKPRSGSAVTGMTGPAVSDMALGSDQTLVVDGWDYSSGGASFFLVSRLGF